MRIFIFICFVAICANALAQELPSFSVLERKIKTNKTYFKRVQLEDLEMSDSFEGKYFRIVNGKSNEAISFTSDYETLLKAATVYYHLTKARKFWLDKIKATSLLEAPKLIVRLDIKNQFDSLGHFAHDNKEPQFNNALSVPQGETPEWVPEERKDKWQHEIWFRPMKKVETKKLPSLGPNPLTTSLEAAEYPFINYTQNRFAQSLLERAFYPSYISVPLWMDVVRFAGTIAMTKAVIEASKHMDPLFLDRYYYLDTAMVPEIIYHEYAHIVLSDNLELTHSTPVIEGMADYFAAVLSDKRRIYAPIKGRSNAAPKDREAQRRLYNHWYEANSQATADFVLSVLWDVRETLGAEIADQLIYEARKTLKTSTATINGHLIQAMLDSCMRFCESPRADQLKLYETFTKKGF